MSFIDFDSFIQESEQKSIQIKVGGKTYAIPAAPRADLMLKVISLEQRKGKGAELSMQETVDMLEGIFSSETLAEISKKLSFDQLTQLLRLVIEEQSKSMTEQGPAGK